MKTFASFILSFMAVTAMSSIAVAQVQLPEFSISNVPTIEFETSDAIDYETAFAKIQNPMMRDTMRLQYQINLLERLIRRQTEIQRIAESYEKIGVPFKQPAPPESSCRQLPVNVLCMAFYPESSKYKDLITERQDEFEKDQRRQMQDMIFDINANGFDAHNNDNPAVAEMMRQQKSNRNPDSLYIWSDIRCLASNCSALLIEKEDPNIRFRIRNGEALPEGGKINKITSSGVVASFEGKNYNLLPEAASGGNQIDPRPDTSNIANLLSDNLGADANNSPAMQELNAAAIPPQNASAGVNDTAPPPILGVTGLF